MFSLLFTLVSAHVIADFLLQNKAMLRWKRQRWFGHPLHALVHAVLAWGLLGVFGVWWVPVAVFLSHWVIDVAKCRAGDGLFAFVADQAAHLAVIALMVHWLAGSDVWLPLMAQKCLVMFAGWVAAVCMARALIEPMIEKYYQQVKGEYEGLRGGGTFIGQLERSLIFLLVLAGQPGGIGFLIAAKSILRFEEAKKQRLSEYILIGTLLSFSLGIVAAYATRQALKLL